MNFGISMKKKLKSFIVNHFMSYDESLFCKKLIELGVQSGDTLMVHSSWNNLNGFKGRPLDIINGLKHVIGPAGLIVMPALTYQNESSHEFLSRKQPMNVKCSPSMMGLVSEVFRRGKEVHRSLSPTHPLTAWGNTSSDFVAGHDSCLFPFGSSSPFEKLLKAKGKILTIDAPFSTITFTHFLEDRIAGYLPFALYDEEVMIGSVIDYDGVLREVPVKVLNAHANSFRREERLIELLDKEGLIRRKKIGNTQLMLIDCLSMANCVDEMYRSGKSFFESPVTD